ncbi:hypothetical protein [Streptomyces sp. NPDC002825]|uniref:hypothetical protein n=1 Tax=Streptomyces sp. NPDC002825 TaxID=3154666 RepID=UPI003317DB30
MRSLPRFDVRALARRAAALRPGRRGGDTVTVPEAEGAGRERLRDLAALPCELGAALLRAGERTAEVERVLHDVAARYGMRVRSFVVPTGLFVRVGGPTGGAASWTSPRSRALTSGSTRSRRCSRWSSGCGRRRCRSRTRGILLLLALGILVGTELLRARPAAGPASEPLGAWAAWVGVLLPPMATWIERRSHMPDQVVFLPCFWLLVPGAVGLTSVSEIIVQGDTAGGLDSLVTMVITVASIALGVLVGAGLQRRPRLSLGEPVPATQRDVTEPVDSEPGR